ncbi:MAG: hypothetical protein H8D23_12435 [Candidatus Brocadiales bacterium]|nr:hypothetical protein [Candidatus Brocadiales bacterium]
MSKTDNDRAYERGVKAGQDAGFFDQVCQSMSKGFNISGKDEIYDKGFSYGVQHQNDKK